MTKELASGPVDWSIRPYHEDDLPAILEVVRAWADAYNPELMLGLGMVRWFMQGPPGSEPHPAVVVTSPLFDGIAEGGLLGAGSYSVEGDEAGKHSYVIHLWGHPAAIPHSVEYSIVKKLFELIGENEARSRVYHSDNVRVFGAYNPGVPGRQELFEAVGMNLSRLFLRMELPLDESIPEPAEVPGVTLRTYRLPEDNVGACAAFNASFSDHWDHHDESQEDWDHGVADPSRRSDLSWLAEIDGKPGNFGGFCICAVHEDENEQKGVKEGWIELLGTTREWRGKGLGRSLLLHGLRSLKSAGLDTALLGVDSESPTGANLLYEKVGFRVRQKTYVYGVALKEAKF